MNQAPSKIYFLLFLAIVIAAVCLVKIKERYQVTESNLPEKQNISPLPPASNGLETASSSSATGYELPATLLLPVPFTPQAPTANWDELHNQACEEASAIMAAFYFSPPKTGTEKGVALDPKIVESEIQKLTEWQDKNFGYHLSINSEETAKMIKEVYGLKAEIVENFDEATLKKTLADGKLILLPANGRMLLNPNFKSPGPKYHMLVIKGYNSQGFLTNDPGTKKGLNYPYSFVTLYNANGDYEHTTEEVDTKQKNVIMIWK